MATRLAVQPSVYESVSRANRQRRAAGRREDPQTAYSAYRAALDVSAARALQSQQLAQTREYQQKQLELQEEQADAAAASGIVSGVTSLAQTGALLYDTFKKPAATPTTTTPAVTTPVNPQAPGVQPSTPAISGTTPTTPALASDYTPGTYYNYLMQGVPGDEVAGLVPGAEAGHVANAGTGYTGGQEALTGAGSALSTGFGPTAEATGAEAGLMANAGAGYEAGAVTSGTEAAGAGGAGGSAGGGLGGGLMAGVGVAGIELTKQPVADTMQEWLGGETEDVVGVTARVGEGALIGGSMGGGYGAAIGAVAGLVVGLGEEIADGSHVCTAAHRKFGLHQNIIHAMGVLKKYGDEHHKDEMRVYLDHCPMVLSLMAPKDRFWFLDKFRKKFAPVISLLVEHSKIEYAFKLYRAVVEPLFQKYAPKLLEELNG